MPYLSVYNTMKEDIWEMKTINNEIKTYFKITGGFNPDDITKALELEPTQTWNKGDKRRISAGNYALSLWEFGKIEKKNNVFADKQLLETISPLLNKVNILFFFIAFWQIVCYNDVAKLVQ